MNYNALPGWFLVGFSGVSGLIIGSFFNVIIYRFPRGESIIFPASHCTSCGTHIPARLNIPVISWLWLRGKCAACGNPINIGYPAVESLTGALSAGLGFLWLRGYLPDSAASAAALAFFILACVPIIIIDIRHMLIPDIINYSGIVLGIGFSLFPGGITFYQSLLGLAAGAVLWAVGYVTGLLLKKEALGLGDVKLLAMAGALFGLPAAVLGMFIASFIGFAVLMPFLLLRRLKRSMPFPFGPFLCLGVVTSVLFGNRLIQWYFSFLER